MICARPNCPNLVHRNGLCTKHHAVTPHGYRPVAPAQVHVARLRRRYDLATLIEATGVTAPTIRAIESGSYTRSKHHAWSALMLLPVPTRPVAGPGILPAIGTGRRIRGLSVMGWSQSYLAERMGVQLQTVNAALRNRVVSSRHAATIGALFDELHLSRGPSGLTVSRALAKGWLPPLAWDEELIDDPETTPDVGCYTPVTFVERYTELLDLGERNEEVIASRLWNTAEKRFGIAPESVKTQCNRFGLGRAS